MEIIALIIFLIMFGSNIVTLIYIPGSITNKNKYYNNDRNTEIGLPDIAIPVSILSFGLLLALIGMYISITANPHINTPRLYR